MYEIEKIFHDFEKIFYQKISELLNTHFDWDQLYQTNLSQIDIHEKNNKVYVRLTIPELSKDHQLKINLIGNQIIVHGVLEKTKEMISDDGREVKQSYSEYFYRNIPLPVQVSTHRAKASYDKGILKISLEKTGELEDRLKEINVDFK